jgi:hypothetical protein
MSDTPPGDRPPRGQTVGPESGPDVEEDITAATPHPGSPAPGPISAADDDPTERTVVPGRTGPARDQLRTPVPYTPAQVPTPQPPPPPQPYPQPGYPVPGYGPPPAYPQPAPLPTTGYVPAHAYDPPPPYAPEAYAPPPEPAPAPAPVPPPPLYPAAAAAPPEYAPPLSTPPTPPRQDGVATAALVCSLIGIPLLVVACTGIPFCIIGIIMGFISRHRIALSGGKLSGEGPALAAIIIGAIGIAFFVLLLLSYLVPQSNTF